jgi:acetyl esterase
MTSTLALRTRVFSALLARVSSEVTTPEQMVAARKGRAKLMALRGSSVIFGRTARGATVTDVEVERDGLVQRFHIHTPIGTSPGARLPVVLNVHGGGWCQGTPEQSEWLASTVAVKLAAVVVSPSYRLAPEQPYPAAVDDVSAALAWVAEHVAEYGGDPTRLAVMGDSAGGNLAAVLALRSREDPALPRIKAQVLIYPAVEMYETFPSEDEFADGPLLTKAGMKRFAHFYMGDSYGVEDWTASPIRAVVSLERGLAGLPPALVISAGVDPLRDNSRRYAAALREAGVAVEEHEFAAAIHGFVSIPGAVPVAVRAVEQIVVYLRRQLG